MSKEERLSKQQELSRTWRGPKSNCTCGHLGDGSDSEHNDNLETGHGSCRIEECGCGQFTWKGYAQRFAKALELIS